MSYVLRYARMVKEEIQFFRYNRLIKTIVYTDRFGVDPKHVEEEMELCKATKAIHISTYVKQR